MSKSLPKQYQVAELSQSPEISALTAKLVTLQENEPFKALTLISATIADGKSAVATSLAINYARKGLRVLLVNANPFDSTNYFDKTSPTTLSAILASDDFGQMHDVVVTVNPYLDLISGDQDSLAFASVEAKLRLQQFIKIASTEYNLVLFDGPAFAGNEAGLYLSDAVGFVLIVLRRDHSKLKATDAMVTDLQSTNVEIIGSVILDR
ncbi:hypothetical protein [Lacticaseibacillus paracasei]|uniref:hypothetical protein n=1 Tax=Lacticaseibacillus paracasei TaxID=1597 RepID=UPI0021A695DC|nr:hypothetical protein [Lacticaseibacillus paracasei]MCT4384161.1 tyrosine-protein kinase family protein [Lacticaseibacillus paracasei]